MTTPRAASIPSLSRRSKILIVIAVVLLALLLIGPRVVDLYTGFLWFSSLGQAGVLRTMLFARLGLFLITGLALAAFTFAGLWLAHRVRPAFLPSPTDDPVVRYRAAVTSKLKTAAIVPPLVVGLIAGVFGQAGWRQVLLFLNREPFGSTDAEFGKDIGFYAFTLPFVEFVLGFLFAGLVLMFLANLIAHYVFGGIRLAGREGSLSRGARIQLASIAGVFLLTKAVAYWFDRYALVYSNRSDMFTGANYTDINAMLPAKAILTGIAIICAAAFFAGIVMRDLRVPAIATVLMLFSSLVVGVGWPAAVQTFSVGPNTERELPYIARNIAATRDAYGLTDAKYEKTESNVTDDALQTLSASDAPSLRNVRLLDPNVVSRAFSTLNPLKEYYLLPDQLAVDRYDVSGRETNVLVAPIELNPARTPTDWTSRHLVYTHGNGLLSAPAGQVDQVVSEGSRDAVNSTAGGQPVFTRNGIGGQQTVKQPRIYFGEIIGSDPDFYSIVGSTGEAREYDSDTEKSRYEGTGGVNVGGWLQRLAYAIKFTERNILLNPNIGPDSKIIYQRDPRDRVKQIAPFLTVDTKTYPVVDSKSGRIVWVVDGYTTLPRYPYAQQTSLSDATGSQAAQPVTPGQPAQRRQPNEKVGYIRNSVKATVDAYDGSVRLYQVDNEDPVLNAWKKVFPGVIEAQDQIPAELRQHLRYPQDLFEVQRFLLQKYHTSDPNTFRQENDVWQVAGAPRDTPDKDGVQAPYYSVAAAPGGGPAQFQLSSILQARDQPYVAARVSVSSEGDDAGRLVVRDVRDLPRRTPGPSQAADLIKGSPPYTADNANITALNPTFGNLQAVSLANGGQVYLWPMYARSTDQNAPKLIKVLTLNPVTSGAGYAPTVAASLVQAGFRNVDSALAAAAPGVAGGAVEGATVPGAPAGPPAPGSPVPATVPGETPELRAAVQAVSDAWGAVLTAQREGNQVAIGEAMQRLNDAVTQLQQADGNAPADGNAAGNGAPNAGGGN